MLAFGKIGNGVLERTAEIRIRSGTAISCPPRCVDRELFQIRQPPLLWDASHLTRRQNRKMGEIDWTRPLETR